MHFGPAAPAGIAVVTGTFLSGAMMSLFMLTVPVLLETTKTPTELLKQWKLIFHRGHVQGPIISIVTGSIHMFAAWRSGERLFAVAGAITIAMIPYTWLSMHRINSALFDASQWSDDVKGSSQGRVRSLVTSWSRYNAVRALFPLSGAVLGMVTLVGRTTSISG